MPGTIDKSKRYLWLATENERRAAEAVYPALNLQLASQHRDMAEQIVDPVKWHAKHTTASEL